MKSVAVVLLTSILMAGCVTRHPMGLNQAQWEALSPDRQAELQARQYAIDAEKRQQAENRRAEQARMAAEEARAEQERLRQIYANAAYGDIVTVTVQGGYLVYSGKLYPYEPVSFDLAKGETKRVIFRGRGQQTVATDYKVRLSEDGNTIYFDDSARQRIVLVNQDWEHGQTYRPDGTRNDVSVAIAGMVFTVRFKNLSGAPNRVIIEHQNR